MNRKSITLVVVVVVCAAWYAYGQGWLGRSRPSGETQNNTVIATPAMDQDKTKVDAVPATQATDEPIGSATK